MHINLVNSTYNSSAYVDLKELCDIEGTHVCTFEGCGWHWRLNMNYIQESLFQALLHVKAMHGENVDSKPLQVEKWMKI